MKKKAERFSKRMMQLSIVIISVVMIGLLSACAKDKLDVKKEVQNSVNKMEQTMDEQVSSEGSVSIEPYDFVKNNEDYEAIIALGWTALPELKQLLEDAEQDSFIEYVYAVALEQLSKVDLMKESVWKTGKEFLTRYTAYVQEIPEKVETIVAQFVSDQEKVEQLKALGVPAIPYIFDIIGYGNEELSPALDYLTDNKSKGDVNKWGVENVKQLNMLQDLAR
ncbi:hypothetical protein ACFSTH_13035 [Paenibacillus yanchengensis]|uniref:Lipoprotein n=1 Tax=Paenibacillus yanchengensis TaxID=2035833 RepID=A0ABW4YPY2_9BACL